VNFDGYKIERELRVLKASDSAGPGRTFGTAKQFVANGCVVENY